MQTKGFLPQAIRVGLLFGLATGLATITPAQSGNDPSTPLPVVILRVADGEASEFGLNEGRFEVFREGSTNLPLLVWLQVGGTATAGADYVPFPNWIAVPAGVRTVPIPVTPIDDNLTEGTEEVTLQLFYPPIMSPLPPDYVIGSPSNGVVRIFDNDAPPPTELPVVTVEATDPVAAEPGLLTVVESGEFIVRRSGPTNLALPVHCQLFGTAANGLDYVTISNVVVIPAGAASVRVHVYPRHDELPEGIETVVLNLLSPPCPEIWPPPPSCYTVGMPAAAVVHILDNDSDPPYSLPIVTVRATDPEASEPGILAVIESGEFTVTRSGSTNHALPVQVRFSGTASNGVDYLAISNVIVIPAGRLSVRVMVNPLHDLLPEGTETVVLNLLETPCPAIWPPPPTCYAIGQPAEALVRILDNDPLPTNRPPAVTLTRPREGESFVLPAKVPLRAEAVDTDGYVPHLEFYAGEQKIGEQTRMFIIPPPPGEHHIFEMTWTNPPTGRQVLRAKARDDDGASGWSEPVTIWVVRTNEPPVTNQPAVVTITAPDAVASEGTNCLRWAGWIPGPGPNCAVTNTALFVIRRTGPTNETLTVHYELGGTAANGVDYVALPGRATIPGGRSAVEIRLVPVDDGRPEGLETVVLGLRAPPETASGALPYRVGSPSRAAAVIADNDQPRPVTSLLPDRCFHFTRPGTNGAWFRVEWSGDLMNWTPLCTNAVVDGALHFVDPDADDSPQRYYRAVPETAPTTE